MRDADGPISHLMRHLRLSPQKSWGVCSRAFTTSQTPRAASLQRSGVLHCMQGAAQDASDIVFVIVLTKATVFVLARRRVDNRNKRIDALDCANTIRRACFDTRGTQTHRRRRACRNARCGVTRTVARARREASEVARPMAHWPASAL